MFKLSSTYGIWIAIVLIAYFLLLKLVGLHQYPAFSIFNGIIYGVGLYMSIKAYRTRTTDWKYEKGFEIGLFTGGIATIIFTVFMAIYMYQIDGVFAANILESWSLDYDLGASMLLVSMLIMGFATTLVLTLAFMQLHKKSWNTPDGNRNIL
ncbi:MAG TPA: DUF4199 domain-containing protein [Aequorivita sp.]|nr:DUF4199 domain-containing protein [Aequorivita sp.]